VNGGAFEDTLARARLTKHLSMQCWLGAGTKAFGGGQDCGDKLALLPRASALRRDERAGDLALLQRAASSAKTRFDRRASPIIGVDDEAHLGCCEAAGGHPWVTAD